MKYQDGNYIQTCPFIGSHLSGIHFDVHSGLSTLAFKNGEQLEYFYIRIIILQQEIILSGENVSSTRLLFQYMKSLSKSDKLKALIAPNIKDPITLLEIKGKSAV